MVEVGGHTNTAADDSHIQLVPLSSHGDMK